MTGSEAKDLNTQITEFFAAGGKKTDCPMGRKPSGKTLDFPLSGGRSHSIPKYPSAKDRSPLVKLLMLSPKGVQIIGPRGKAILTREDVAGALAAKSPNGFTNGEGGIEIEYAKLSKEAYQYAMARYLEDEQSKADAQYNAWMVALELKDRHGWKTVIGKDILRNVGLIAYGNVTGFPALTFCDKCNGSGNNQQGKCGKCQGTGKSKPSFRKLARLIGATNSDHVQKVWAPRIKQIEQRVRRWEQDVVNHLYYQFQGDE